ncbi:hypothetical protein FOMPIDRAFT_1045076 [Fomitopsis schrenkii]|uniref:Uncharacterized protein n=1 Tax=Fomitopsis schrenkii TaxID=2126942 RepID=S8ES86_FOMSC|nr:hypothetical protein FOMPIDRAFT_1045076 [Fomitopsis schrenkii]
MPQAAYLGLSPKQRLQSITDAEPAAVLAASHALALQDIPTAIELLEQGRAVFWQQATRLRTPLASSQIPLNKQNEINQLLHSLDNQPVLLDPQDRRSVEQEEAKRWRQTQRLEELLKEFRKQFEAEAKEHSLFPPEYPSLIQAAKKGPIVVLLSTPVFSGAVIIRQGGASDLVHLPEANPNWLGGWVQSWNNYVESARALPRDARAAYLVGLRNISHSQHELLEELWDIAREDPCAGNRTARHARDGKARVFEGLDSPAASVTALIQQEPKPSQMQDATPTSSWPNIAWLLNLRGDVVPFNPVLHCWADPPICDSDVSLIMLEHDLW